MVLSRFFFGPFLLVLGFAGSLGSGCAPDPRQCPGVQGVYQPLYTQLNGTCGPIPDPNNVLIEGDLQIQNLSTVEVHTQTQIKGCYVSMTQQVIDRRAGVLQRRIVGDLLDVMSSTHVSGRVTLTRYDAAGLPICAGEYQAELTKDTITHGGAIPGGG